MPKSVEEPHSKERDRTCEQRTEVISEFFPRFGCQLLEGLGHREWEENVVFEKCTQRDVPSFPELGDRAGEERTLEVFRHVDAEDLCGSDDQIHGAGEVAVELDRVEDRSHGDEQSVIGPVIREDFFYERIDTVDHHDLFHETVKDALQTCDEITVLDALCIPELFGSVGIAAYRAFHDLREETHEHRQTQEAPVRGDLLAVYIEEIRYSLKRIEGNADRYPESPHADVERCFYQMEKTVEVSYSEPGVLQYEKDPDVKKHGKRHDPALFFQVKGIDLFLFVAVLLIDPGKGGLAFVLRIGEPQSEVVDRKSRHDQVQHELSADRVEKDIARQEQYQSSSALRKDLVKQDRCS